MEPKWNVKSLLSVRNHLFLRINGTKVECKGTCNIDLSALEEVLMEPKWNVKRWRCPLRSVRTARINGTKVECKESGRTDRKSRETVLMEPKWNVKEDKASYLYEAIWY